MPRGEIRFTVPLPPVTKKNSQRLVPLGNGGHKILPSKAYQEYEKNAGYFLPHKGAMMDSPCEVIYLFYMQTNRIVDLTNLEQAMDDVLVKYRVLRDDNSRIIVSHDGSRVLYDKERPRTEVVIRSL